MANSLWIVILLFPSTVQTQSGGGSSENEPRMFCTSHLSVFPSGKSNGILTCHIDGNTNGDDDDDDDDENEDVEAVTLCVANQLKPTCFKEKGYNFTFKGLLSLPIYNLNIQFKRSGTFSKTIVLKKIIKPKSPWVEKATFLGHSNRAVIEIGNPYLKDYLKPDNQQFELHIWSDKNYLVHNITRQTLVIEREYLKQNTEYHVKVRAKPVGYFDGFWSEWSSSVSFTTDTGTPPTSEPEQNEPVLLYALIVTTVALLLVISLVLFYWRKEIHSIIWPSIPHPKHTLVQMYKPNKGPPVSFNPELFSDLNIQLVEQVEDQHLNPESPDMHDNTEVKGEWHTQECTENSSSTGGSEPLLLGSRSPGEHLGAGSRGSSMDIPGLTREPESKQTEDCNGNVGPVSLRATQPGKDEAYVTMSSFYQIQ